MNIKIIYEDKNIVAINKPAGLLIHEAQNMKHETLVDWLIENYPEVKKVGDDPEIRPGIVHRLDRDTSGILLIAKNQKTFEYLKKQFQEKKIKKTYLALIEGKINKKSGTIDIPIGRSPKTPTKRLAHKRARGKLREAITEYNVEQEYKEYTLLRVSPKTGRTHQIRVHLKAISKPIVCDKVYTKTPVCPFGLQRHFLHASSLEFSLPQNGKIKLEADLPEDLQRVLNNLENCDRKE